VQAFLENVLADAETRLLTKHHKNSSLLCTSLGQGAMVHEERGAFMPQEVCYK